MDEKVRYSTLTDEGIQLPTGELLTKGRVFETAMEAIRLCRAGDKIGLYEIMDVDKLEEEGWSKDEIRTLALIDFDNTNLFSELDDALESKEVEVYLESKKNNSEQQTTHTSGVGMVDTKGDI